jgi:hypothetical protein
MKIRNIIAATWAVFFLTLVAGTHLYAQSTGSPVNPGPGGYTLGQGNLPYATAVATATNFGSTGAGTNALSIALTPGQWFCIGNAYISTAGGTSGGPFTLGWNTVTATLPTVPAGGYVMMPTLTAGAGGLATGLAYFNSSGNQTVYLNTALTYGSGTPQFVAHGDCFRMY